MVSARARSPLRAARLALSFACLAMLLAHAPAMAGEGPPCSARSALDPPRAVVGEQVLYRAWVERSDAVTHVEWIRTPGFPGARAERLPGRPEVRIESKGAAPRWLREESRALFPSHPGEWIVGEAAIRCTTRRADQPDAVHEVILSPLALQVEALPAAGDPRLQGGLVGAVRVALSSDRTSLRLGESFALRLSMHGAANVWDVPSPLADLALDQRAELFIDPPEIVLEPGERLHARRWDRVVVVPRQPGRLDIPALHVSYFAPDARVYRSASTEPISIEVKAPAEASPPASATAGETRATDPISAESFFGPKRRGLRWLAPALGVALLAVVALGWPAFDARRRRWRAAERALAAAQAARRAGDAHAQRAALERAVRATLAVLAPALSELPADEITQESAGDDLLERAASILSTFEEDRFGGGAADSEPGPVSELLDDARNPSR